MSHTNSHQYTFLDENTTPKHRGVLSVEEYSSRVEEVVDGNRNQVEMLIKQPEKIENSFFEEKKSFLIEEGILLYQEGVYSFKEGFLNNLERSKKQELYEKLKSYGRTRKGESKLSSYKYALAELCEYLGLSFEDIEEQEEEGKQIIQEKTNAGMKKIVQTFLDTYTCKRLTLEGPREKIDENDVGIRESDNGFLCILENGQYRKIGTDDFKKLGIESMNPQNMSFIIDNFSEFRKSDFQNHVYTPRRVNSKGLTSSFNGRQFSLPSQIAGNESTILIDRSKIKLLQISENQVVIYDGLVILMLDTSNVAGSKKVVNTKETSKRISEFDILDYIPVKKNENHQAYARRVNKYFNIEFLAESYKEIFDNGNLNLQDYPIDDQFSFSIFYQGLTLEKKTIVNKYLTELGSVFFKAFKICEDSIHNGNLILDIVSSFSGEQLEKILVKLSDILDTIEKNKQEIEAIGADIGEFDTQVVSHSIHLLEKIISHKTSDFNKINTLLDNTKKEFIQAGITFKITKNDEN